MLKVKFGNWRLFRRGYMYLVNSPLQAAGVIVLEDKVKAKKNCLKKTL